MKNKISIIAAIGKNRELGKGNDLIWKISSDLKRFKELTTGHPIIMGRKTFESIGRVLPDRTNIIVTRDINNLDSRLRGNDNIRVVDSTSSAIEEAKQSPGADEIFVIGGGQIFSEVIGITDKLYLTVVDAEDKNAEVFFPDYSEFRKVVRKESGEENGLKFEYLDLER